MENPYYQKFLDKALGTMPLAAVKGPLASIWPTEERNRPVSTPWAVCVEEGYILDPEWSGDYWPTNREYWGYDSMSVEEKIYQLIEATVGDEQGLAYECDIRMPPSGWDRGSLVKIEEALGSILEDPLDPDHMSFQGSLELSAYAVGGYLLDELSDEEQNQFELTLVEGDHPGSSFCGVYFEGDIVALNKALAHHGINITVYDYRMWKTDSAPGSGSIQ